MYVEYVCVLVDCGDIEVEFGVFGGGEGIV